MGAGGLRGWGRDGAAWAAHERADRRYTGEMPFSWLKGKPTQTTHVQRATERHAAQGLNCPELGELVDLSIGGLRCRCASKPRVVVGQRLPLVIQGEAQSVRVTGMVVWVRRMSLTGGEYQLGVKFLEVRPGVQQALGELAKFGHIDPKLLDAMARSDEGNVPPIEATQGHDSARAGSGAPTMRVEVENLYEHLGVGMDADESEIKRAYHKLALRYHPDHCSDEQSTRQFALISKSFSVLRDAERRRRYDQMLRASMGLPESA